MEAEASKLHCPGRWYGTGSAYKGVLQSHSMVRYRYQYRGVLQSHTAVVWYGTGPVPVPYRGMVQLRIYVTFVPYGTVQLRKYITFATRVWYCNSHLRLEFTSQHTVNVKLARKLRYITTYDNTDCG